MRSERPGSWGWLFAGALFIAALYLPMLAAPFDFVDDGNLVYAAPPQPLVDRVRLVWQKIVANAEHLGPFRPALWAHWELQAEMFGGSPVSWRLARLLWGALAAGMLLWLLRELGISPWAALFTAALAMWNPYRGEIWRSLTLSEGIAIPYALFALICAVRAARSSRPVPWDLAGFAAVLVALGCKNTFAAIVPAQMILRITADGSGWREGWRRHGSRAAWLPLTLLLPAAHFVYFQKNWHPGQYEVGAPTVSQLGRILTGLTRAISLEAFAAGFALTGVALVAARRGPTPDRPERLDWRPYRPALLAAAALLVFGIGAYLPPRVAMGGRYTIPAAWGLDLGVAVLSSVLFRTPWPRWKRAALVAFGAALAFVAVSAVARQLTTAAQSRVVWQALHFVEREAPPGAGIAWTVSPAVGADRTGEAIHFGWHLGNRSRRDLRYRLIDDEGRPHPRPEILGPAPERLDVVLTTGPVAPRLLRSDRARWERVPFRTLLGRGRWHECYVWIRRPADG